MQVKVQKDKKTGEYYLDLYKILEGSNVKVEDVEYYTLEPTDTQGLRLWLYDKNKKKLEVKNGNS